MEPGDFVSYSKSDQLRFRDWLKSRYQNVSQVNERWSSGYSEWRDIEIPVSIENETVWGDWVDARTEWLEDWARDTMRFIREVDSPAVFANIDVLFSLWFPNSNRGA